MTTSDALTRLASIMGLETSRRFVVAWPDVEATIGLPLPEDYKRLVEYFGPGAYDGFVTVNVPGIANKACELGYQLDSFGQIQQENPDAVTQFAPHLLHPRVGGVLLWGSTTAGDLLFWEPSDVDPNRWPVLAWDVEDADWFRFDGGCVEFLLAFFAETLDLPMILPREDEGPMQFVTNDGAWHGPGPGLTPTSFFASDTD